MKGNLIPVVVDVLAHVMKKDGAASDKFSDMQSPVIWCEEQFSTQLAGSGLTPRVACASVLDVTSVKAPQSQSLWWQPQHCHPLRGLWWLVPAIAASV